MPNLRLFTISLTWLFLNINGQSTQLVGPGPVCSSSDVASYQCTWSGGTTITWEVMSTCGTNSIGRSFNYFNQIGATSNVRLCSSTLILTLTSATNSSISSTLTIDRPLLLNGTRITCVDETIQLLVVTSFNIIPPSTVIINCTSYGEVSNFSMTWQPQDMRDFTVIVYPNQTFNNTTTPITFQYEHVIPFTVSIIQQDCTEDIITTFILSCRLRNDYCTNVIYTLHVDSNMSARLETSEGDRMLTCVNNEWKEETSSIMDKNGESTGIAVALTTTDSTGIAAALTTTEGLPAGPVIMGVVAGIAVFIISIGVLLSLTAILWRYHLREKNKCKIGKVRANENEDCAVYQNDEVYSQLNNRHNRAAHEIQNDQDEYSIVNHNIQAFHGPRDKYRNPAGYDTITARATKNDITLFGYETLDTNKTPSNECFQLKYTDVSVAKCEHHKPNLIHNTVNYSIIDVRVCPEDKRLNLDSLIMQLRPMEEHYKQFGVRAGIPTAMLDAIESSSLKAYDGLVEVCDYWLRKCKEENIIPTWRIVAEILSLIGQYQLSHDLLEVYKTGKLPIEVDINSLVDDSQQPPPLPPPLNPKDILEDQEEVVMKPKALEVETPPLPPKLPPKPAPELTPRTVPARLPKPRGL